MCFTLAPPSTNFNLLHAAKADQSSQMDLDEEDSADISMVDLGNVLPSSTNSQPRKVPRMESKLEKRVLFRSESSFEGSLNQTAISAASSTIHDLDGVGLPMRKEEETINTKFAMKELSMMFSSPACGADEMARKTESALNTTILNNSNDVSYDNMVNLTENHPLDNSVFNIESSGQLENDGPKNPHARSTGTPGFHSTALSQLEADSEASRSLSCVAQTGRSIEKLSQDNPLQRRERDMQDNPGFTIFEDSNEKSSSSSAGDSTNVSQSSSSNGGNRQSFGDTASLSLFNEVFTDIAASDNEETSSEKAQPPSSKSSFAIFVDDEMQDQKVS